LVKSWGVVYGKCVNECAGEKGKSKNVVIPVPHRNPVPYHEKERHWVPAAAGMTLFLDGYYKSVIISGHSVAPRK
jgi:hypothetical protein